MILTFRPIKVWPEGWPNNRGTYSRFDTSYARTLEDLDRELIHLGATDTALAVNASESDCRLDGQLRANAKVGYRGVILAFSTKKFGTLTYPCDTFEGHSGRQGWQENLRAIALGLEALRKVERYGIAKRGQQYAGYAELPSGIALGTAMTVEEAARFLGEVSECSEAQIRAMAAGELPELIQNAFRVAAKELHPDVGGDPDLFRKLVQSKELLEAQP